MTKFSKKLMIPLMVFIKVFLLLLIGCEKDRQDPVELPTLITISISSITSNNAKSGGNITNDGGSDITSRGIVWATSPNPTAEQNIGLTMDGAGPGLFQSNITNLQSNTTYFVRAYATNSAGLVYGNEQQFTTEGTAPTVTTSQVTNITQNSATSGGNVTDDGGASVTARGVVWSTSQIPSIEGNLGSTSDGAGTGSFSSNLGGLIANTTYYVRAYATTSNGTGYGESIEFNTHQIQAWSQKSNFGGTARTFATGFSIANKGFIGTGLDNNFRKDFWEFDPVNNTWTQKTNFGGSARFVAVSFSSSIYGYIGSGSQPSPVDSKEFWEYNYQNNSWAQKASYPGDALGIAVGFSIGDKGYIGTGSAGPTNPYLNDFWEYDRISNTWTRKADFPGLPRQGAVGFNIGSKGYVGTGIGEYGIMKDFWEYNPMNDTWTQKADFGGTARYNAVAFVINEKAYVGTGREISSAARKDIWEYDPNLNSWTRKTDLLGQPRWGAVAFSIANKGYVGTGFDGNNDFRDFYEYDPQYDTP